MKFRSILSALLLSINVGTAFASSEFNPHTQPINVVIPFAPGGGVDSAFRHFEKYALTKHNIKMIPIYKSGADGAIGMNEITGMAPNGYNIGFVTVGTLANHRVKYDLDRVTIITGIKNSIMALVTNRDSNIKSLDDIFKSETISLAYGAPGQQMFLDQLVQKSSIKERATMVPFKGGGPVVQSIMGNHVLVGAVPLQIVQNQVDSGTLRLLAVSSKNQLSEYNNAPSIFTKFPDWKNNDGFVVVIPNNAHPAVIKYWSDIFKEYMNDPQVQQDFVKERTELIPFGRSAADQLVNNAVSALKTGK
jgi:tripartite-type tricarboxylate transporter receptor subunit TctC